MITLGDQPLITPQVIAAVLDRADGPPAAARATFGGAPGHPVVVKRDACSPSSRSCAATRGARDLLEAHGVATVECGHLASAHDVDTPADLEAIAGRASELEVSG